MEDKIYTITLSNGTVLDGLHMNGSTFVSDKPIDPRVFRDNCIGVVISYGEGTETHAMMEYVKTAQPVSGEFHFALRDVSEQEITMMRMQANIEYIGMMAGVEI